jgi:23S rRNA (cytosine1962-C5)-methyltransferase
MNTDYKLLDTGDEKRLEQFGSLRIVRAAKQALWKPALPKSEWKKADAVFDEEWRGDTADFSTHFDDVCFSLGMLESGQVGIFPEQLENWMWLAKVTAGEKHNIINGFAYTGGSTMFASNHINKVTHLDASKPAIKRAKENAELSFRKENDIRFVQEDVMTFLKKEIKRGKHYDGFIFDPPAFGTGGKGKKWKLGKDLPELLEMVYELSGGNPAFILLSAHDPALDHVKLAKMIKKMCPKSAKIESGDLTIKAESGNDLKNGYFARCLMQD